METDSGTELNNHLIRNFFINEIGILMRFGEPGRHIQQCSVERIHQEIQKPLIERINVQELKTEEPSVEWVEDFRTVVDAVDKKWRHDPPKVPLGLPRISKNDKLLLKSTQVRVKLDEPISILGKNYTADFVQVTLDGIQKSELLESLFPDQPQHIYLVDLMGD